MHTLFFQKYASRSSAPKTAIICLHGWGFHSDIWQPIAKQLAIDRDVYLVDLPGYGRSPLNSAGKSLAGIAELLQAQFTFTAIYMGWSLGGLCVQQLALDYPDKVKALVLVASSPCFIQQPDWSSAMPISVFNNFADQMQANVNRTLNRFLSLQVMGSTAAAALTRQLKQNLAKYPTTTAALKIGLGFLKNTDLRPQSAQIRCPCYLCLGDKDRIVPIEIAEAWQPYWQNSSPLHIVRFKKAAHLPFLSHPDLFFQHLTDFLNHVD